MTCGFIKLPYSTRKFEHIHDDEGLDLTQNSVIYAFYQTTKFRAYFFAVI